MLIVVRGYDYRGDLAALRPYIWVFRPLLMGVDGGADALIEAGYKPDMIIGDMDSCTDETLCDCGAELVVHAYHDGRAPGGSSGSRNSAAGSCVPRTRHQRGRRHAAR